MRLSSLRNLAKRLRLNSDVYTGIGVAAFGAVVLRLSFQIRQPMYLVDSLGPRAFPATLGIALCIFGGIIAVKNLIRYSGRVEAGGEGFTLSHLFQLAVISFWFVIFVFLWTHVGFLPAGTLFVFVLLRLNVLGRSRVLKDLLLATLTSFFLWVVFSEALSVPLELIKVPSALN